MAQRKAHEVEDWLKRRSSEAAIVLLYGPDQGLVAERAAHFARQTGIPLDDAFAVVRLDATELDREPGRLIDEAMTIPLFGGRRLIWVRHASAQKTLADAVKAIAATPPPDTLVLIEADDLKKSAPLRGAVEAAEAAMALPCYADEAKNLDALIDEVLGKAGLRIESEARRLLKQGLGADRLASRGELDKLALYAHGRSAIGVEDVAALSADTGQSSADAAVDRMLEGAPDPLDHAMQKLLAGGAATYPLLAAALRQFQQLQLMRAAIDGGRVSASQAVASARPPVFFSRRRTIEQTLHRLDARTIETILQRLMAAILESRQNADLAEAITRRVLTAIALEMARR